MGGEEFSVTDASSAADASRMLAVEARLTANTEKFFLNDVLSADVAWREAWRATDGTFSNIQRADTPSRQVKNELELIRRFGRRTLTVRSATQYLRSPQSLAVERDGGAANQRSTRRRFGRTSRHRSGGGSGVSNLSLAGGLSQLVRRLESALEAWTSR